MKRIKPVWLAGEQATSITVVKKDGKLILVGYEGQVELARREAQMILAIAKDNEWQAYQRKGAETLLLPPFPVLLFIRERMVRPFKIKNILDHKIHIKKELNFYQKVHIIKL